MPTTHFTTNYPLNHHFTLPRERQALKQGGKAEQMAGQVTKTICNGQKSGKGKLRRFNADKIK